MEDLPQGVMHAPDVKDVHHRCASIMDIISDLRHIIKSCVQLFRVFNITCTLTMYNIISVCLLKLKLCAYVPYNFYYRGLYLGLCQPCQAIEKMSDLT